MIWALPENKKNTRYPENAREFKWLREQVPCLPEAQRLPYPLIVMNKTYSAFNIGHTSIEQLISTNLWYARQDQPGLRVHGFSMVVDPRPRFNVQHLSGNPTYSGFSDDPTYLEIKDVVDAMLKPISCPQDFPVDYIKPSINIGTSADPKYILIAGPMDELDESGTIMPLKRDYGYGDFSNNKFLSVLSKHNRDGGWCAGCFSDTWNIINNDDANWQYTGTWQYLSFAPFGSSNDFPLRPHSTKYPYPTPHGFPIQYYGPLSAYHFFGGDESTTSSTTASVSIDLGLNVQTVRLHAAKLSGRGKIQLLCDQYNASGTPVQVASYTVNLGTTV